MQNRGLRTRVSRVPGPIFQAGNRGPRRSGISGRPELLQDSLQLFTLSLCSCEQPLSPDPHIFSFSEELCEVGRCQGSPFQMHPKGLAQRRTRRPRRQEHHRGLSPCTSTPPSTQGRRLFICETCNVVFSLRHLISAQNKKTETQRG